MATNTLPSGRREPVPMYMYTKRLNGYEVRLLVILPGKVDAQIECKLVVHETDNLPAYEALSYVWGTSTKLKPILCDGYRIDVTPNLLFALKQLRYEDERRLLWIDYVCINQDDNDEKTGQVQLMKTIYSEASRVVSALILPEEVYAGPEALKEKLAKKVVENSEKIEAFLSFIQDAWFTRIWCVQEIVLAQDAVV
ncbi:HET-domain-containing protein, partial [Lophium mytilinum]